MDWLAIVSYGVYPTPTPTEAARAAYAISYGLLGDAPTLTPIGKLLKIIGSNFKKLIGG